MKCNPLVQFYVLMLWLVLNFVRGIDCISILYIKFPFGLVFTICFCYNLSVFLTVIGPFLRASSLLKLVRQSSSFRLISTQTVTSSQKDTASPRSPSFFRSNGNPLKPSQYGKNDATVSRPQIGENVSPRDKINILISTILDLDDSKEAIYNALDAWVAWEKDFPIGRLKIVLLNLEKQQQWHRIIQVIKWMLSKGQGNTMGTYGQLIQALDMDHRAKEAHEFWNKKIGSDYHAVPWKLCKTMIAVYYRNNMLHDLVKLFKGLEAFDRKPPEKSIVQKVANAYELLDLVEEKERVLEKYKELFVNTGKGRSEKSGSSSSEKKKKKKVMMKKAGEIAEEKSNVSDSSGVSEA